MKEQSEKEMIDKITNRIKDLGKEIRDNTSSPIEDRVYQMDVLLDTMRFLENYDENVIVLNKYYSEKSWEERHNIR